MCLITLRNSEATYKSEYQLYVSLALERVTKRFAYTFSQHFKYLSFEKHKKPKCPTNNMSKDQTVETKSRYSFIIAMVW